MCVDVLAFYRIIFHFNAFNLFLYDNISISKLNIFLFSSRCIFFVHDCTNTFTISYIDVVCYAYVSISRQFSSFFIHRTISIYQNIFLYNIYIVCGWFLKVLLSLLYIRYRIHSFSLIFQGVCWNVSVIKWII